MVNLPSSVNTEVNSIDELIDKLKNEAKVL